MKAFTSIEQSKKLAEFLPLESADMSYRPCREEGGIPDYQLDLCPHKFASWIGFPCWSLAALLNILPSATLDTSDDHYCRVRCRERCTEWHDNSIDACYEMIIKLHEQKIL